MCAIAAATPTGFGGEVDVDVLENLSPSPEDDFLKPKPGGTLTVFTTETDKARAGDLVEIEANLLGGPFGERAVTSHVTKL